MMSKAASSPLAGVHRFCSSSSAGFQPTDATQACAYDHDVKVSGLRLRLERERVTQPASQICGGLVLGCIETKFCKKICASQHLSILQDLHTFAPLQTQHLAKNQVQKPAIFVNFKVKSFSIFSNVAKSAFFAIKLKISARYSCRSQQIC